jgi:hypothetical protein
VKNSPRRPISWLNPCIQQASKAGAQQAGPQATIREPGAAKPDDDVVDADFEEVKK